MSSYLDKLDINQYMPAAIAWATNILLAIVILLVGLWFAGKVKNLIIGFSKKYEQLDITLFTFLGNVARYIILAFVAIAVLNRFGVQTASIVALLGANGAGKTTTIKSISNILKTERGDVTKGSISFEGEQIQIFQNHKSRS